MGITMIVVDEIARQLVADVKNGGISREIVSVFNKVANPNNQKIKSNIFHIKDDFDLYKDLLNFDELTDILSNIDSTNTEYIGYKGGDKLCFITNEDIYYWVSIFADFMVSYVVQRAYEDDCRVLYKKYVTKGIREF